MDVSDATGGFAARRGVILAAHGAGDESNANARVRRIAAECEECLGTGEVPVIAAFNLGTPGFADALDSINAENVTVIPIMTSEGYFTRQRLPLALDGARRVREHGYQGVEVTAPVGEVRSLVKAVRDRAVAEIDRLSADDEPVAVVVIGHGTRRNAQSGESTRRLADELADHLVRGRVVTAFLDQEPLLEHVAAQLRERRAVFVPFMIGGGGHVEQDIGERIAQGRAGSGRVVRDVVLPAVADEPLEPALVEAVRSLIAAHAPDRVFRIGTRSSPLAIRQAEMVIEALSAAGLGRERTEIVRVSTVGDRDQRTPLDELAARSAAEHGIGGVFTDELEDGLIRGEFDLAVHSYKDLPLEHDEQAGRDTVIAAVLPRGSVGEVLVTKDGGGLSSLARGARVGTSSPRRTAQLLALRPDLEIMPLRGGVDQRLRSVVGSEHGGLDAAVLAEAGIERLGEHGRIAERFDVERFVPEAAQGAIAISVRSDDRPARALVSRIDHAETRRAVETERTISRRIEARETGWIAAAYAHVNGSVRLRARAIHAASGEVRDAAVEHATPEDAIAGAIAQLFSNEDRGGGR